MTNRNPQRAIWRRASAPPVSRSIVDQLSAGRRGQRQPVTAAGLFVNAHTGTANQRDAAAAEAQPLSGPSCSPGSAQPCLLLCEGARYTAAARAIQRVSAAAGQHLTQGIAAM